LVPFGEYLPFSRTILPIAKKFNLPVSTIIPGREQPNIITPNTRILPTICYEIAYTNTVRKSLRKSNAYVIMNLSEDGWFGSSWGPLQHLEMARMRALENGRYVLRSTTSGVTAIINEKGEIIARLPQFERGVLRGEFKEFTKYTPWTYIGVYPLLAFMLILLAAILYSYRHKLKVIELDSLSLTSLAPKQAVNCQSNCAQLLEL
jgi:apolipoprotein N-acyltransferase